MTDVSLDVLRPHWRRALDDMKTDPHAELGLGAAVEVIQGFGAEVGVDLDDNAVKAMMAGAAGMAFLLYQMVDAGLVPEAVLPMFGSVIDNQGLLYEHMLATSMADRGLLAPGTRILLPGED